jgi:hypothetical protein
VLSIKSAAVESALTAGPRFDKAAGKPMLYVEEYVTVAVLIVLIEPTEDASFADILAPSRLGMAMAARIRMMATTTSNSMSENPF